MKTITTTEALKRLEKNPAIAAQFDAAAGGSHNRKAEVERCIARLNAAGEVNALKAQLADARSTLDAAKRPIFSAEERAFLLKNKGSISKLNAWKAEKKQTEQIKADTAAKAKVLAARKPVQATQAKTAPAPSRFADASDGFLFQAATHRCSPAKDKLEAKAELERRGFTVSPDNVISKSFAKNKN